MSRVFEALCRSQEELGSPRAPLDPENFVSADAIAAAEPSHSLDWEATPTFIASAQPQRLVALPGQNGLGAEKFRLLRARLRHLQERTRLKSIVITSAIPEEGKTLVASNLAITLAKNTAQRVLLVDGDLRKPAVAARFGLAGARGISEWWSTDEPIQRFLYHLQDTQLWLLCAGVAHEHPLAILQSARFLKLFRTLGESFDWLVIDVPPLSPLADANFWARQAEGLLLVVRHGKAPLKLLQAGLQSLDNPRVLGVILNDATPLESDYYNHYYAHSNHSSETSH